MNLAFIARPAPPSSPSPTDRERIAELEAMVAQLEVEKRELEVLARVDALTGLGNRRAFEDALEVSTSYAARFEGKLSLLLIDLDGMKRLNDEHGHPVGDQGLAAVGALLRAMLRSTDVACRCGGDEFAVVLPGTGRQGALHVAEKIRAAIAELLLHLHGEKAFRPFSASIGVATFGATPPSPLEMGVAMQLVKVADEALYAAKRTGKNRVVDGNRNADSDDKKAA